MILLKARNFIKYNHHLFYMRFRSLVMIALIIPVSAFSEDSSIIEYIDSNEDKIYQEALQEVSFLKVGEKYKGQKVLLSFAVSQKELLNQVRLKARNFCENRSNSNLYITIYKISVMGKKYIKHLSYKRPMIVKCGNEGFFIKFNWSTKIERI